MRLTLWGTRGSLPSPRPGTARYGGNTSCVQLEMADGSVVVLDAGTGIHRLPDLGPKVTRVDVLLSHLHMDHILGLGFFGALFQPHLEVHLWGPPSTTMGLHGRLTRYLSPPLFPVRLRDLPCQLVLHDAPRGTFDLPGATVTGDLICHPGLTMGYRIRADGVTIAYLPDHEPALGADCFPKRPEWTSGFDLMAGVDLLIHDAQYSDAEYPSHVGWGHSSISQTLALAEVAEVGRLVAFHHDPNHDDRQLDRLYAEASEWREWPFTLIPAMEGSKLTLGHYAPAQ